MSYALISTSDVDDPDFWYCYHIARDKSDLTELKCYKPSDLLMLSKADYQGLIVTAPFDLPSCVKGNSGSFVICQINSSIMLSNIIVSV